MSAEGHRSGIILIHKTDMAGVRTITIQPVNDASGKGFFFVGTVEEKAIVGQILADAIPSIACCFPVLTPYTCFLGEICIKVVCILAWCEYSR